MNIAKLVVSIGLCFAVAFLGSAVTTPSIAIWYTQLNKPSFSPPNWIFGPVWTILYLLMGISLYLIWQHSYKNKRVKTAVNIFFVQLALNLFWSAAFFAFHLPFAAFIVIVALWIFIILTMKYFYRISKIASYLLIPYILWVSFAALLNLFIALLN